MIILIFLVLNVVVVVVVVVHCLSFRLVFVLRCQLANLNQIRLINKVK